MRKSSNKRQFLNPKNEEIINKVKNRGAILDTEIKALTSEPTEYLVKIGFAISLRVRPGGGKSFIYKYTLDKKRKTFTYGNYPEVSLAQAMAEHQQKMKEVKGGQKDILFIKQQEKSERINNPTVAELGKEYYERVMKKNLKDFKTPFGLLKKNIFPVIGSRKIKDIERREIVNALQKVLDRGAPVVANRTLSQVKVMFSYAVEQGFIEYSPAQLIKKKNIGGIEKPRDRFLSEIEIREFLELIDSAPFSVQVRLVLKILLYTGKRLSEVLTMEVSEVDLENRVWEIPAQKSKTKLADKIYLTDSVIVCIQNLISMNSGSKWVVATLYNLDGHIRYQSVDKALRRHQNHFDFTESFVAHDLRRTTYTHMRELGIPYHTAERILNHSIKGVTKHYDLSELWEEKVKAWQLWESKILSIKDANNKIIPFIKEA